MISFFEIWQRLLSVKIQPKRKEKCMKRRREMDTIFYFSDSIGKGMAFFYKLPIEFSEANWLTDRPIQRIEAKPVRKYTVAQFITFSHRELKIFVDCGLLGNLHVATLLMGRLIDNYDGSYNFCSDPPEWQVFAVSFVSSLGNHSDLLHLKTNPKWQKKELCEIPEKETSFSEEVE